MEDQKLIELYFNRDERAIEETQKQYQSYCFSIAYRILNNFQDCQEVLNDSYLAAWNAIPPQKPECFATFIGKITRNLALKKLRFEHAEKRGHGEPQLSLEELENTISGPMTIGQQVDVDLLTEMINDFLANCKADDRKMFVCRYWYFETVEEIAQRFDFSASKVKMSLLRTREKLRIYLTRQGVIE